MSDAHFSKGQWVEVTSDEEGFRGAWFVAKIIKLPLVSNDASSSSKTKMMKKNNFLVEYQSIMEDEKGTKCLREYVHSSCTRPLPPKEPVHVFELNELVDAFDRDGWWKGVITEILEKGSKYVVYFKITEEKLEFSPSDLRVHLEWTDGQWSKPGKQQQQQQQKEIKQNDAEGSKKDVKKRGRPPKVKSATEQGKVVCKSTEIDKQSIGSSKKRRGNARKYKVKDKGSGLKAFGPQASYDADMSITEVLRDIADEFQSPPVTDNEEVASRKNPSVVSTRILSDIADEYQSPPIIDNKGISPDGILVSKSNNAATKEDPSCRTEILRDTADEHQSSPMIDNKEISPDKVSQSNKVVTKEETLLKDLEIPESFNLPNGSEKDTCMGNQCHDVIKEQNEMGPVSVDSQCSDSGEVFEVSLTSVYNRCDEETAKQNQMESSINHEIRKEHNEVHLEQAPVIGSTNDELSLENESLPFVKTSLMWERILTMEIFQKIPQKPHFRPLKQYNTAQREGMAIGHMVTFANVVAKTRVSHIDDPRSNLEEMSKALVDLEAHGFNVQAIQSRVQRLLVMKDKQLMLEKKSKEAEVKIIELKNEKDKFKTQLDKVKENLRFHEEATIRFKNEYDVLVKEMEKNGSDTSVLQMELDAMEDNKKSVKIEYPNVAADPW